MQVADIILYRHYFRIVMTSIDMALHKIKISSLLSFYALDIIYIIYSRSIFLVHSTEENFLKFCILNKFSLVVHYYGL